MFFLIGQSWNVGLFIILNLTTGYKNRRYSFLSPKKSIWFMEIDIRKSSQYKIHSDVLKVYI